MIPLQRRKFNHGSIHFALVVSMWLMERAFGLKLLPFWPALTIRGVTLYAAKQITKHAQRVSLSERDSLRLLKVLEKPPPPNARLLRAARCMPKPK